MELLRLPEPAAGIWKRTAEALHKALAQTRNAPPRWSIGGGTILAERWQHRGSADIDLTAPAGTGIDRLNTRSGGTLEADMKALGAGLVSTGRTRHQVMFKEGTIDIAELDARPATGATKAVAEGYEIDVKSTTQILRGKLERALRQESPARDLFDIAVAHHTDPDALAHAANMLDEEEVRHIKAHWKTNSHRLEQEASDKLADINPEYEAERRQLVDRATRRLEGALYQAVQIDATRSGLRVETRTTGRAPRVMTINSADVAATLNRTGMNEFLDRDCAGGLRKVLTKAAAARAIGNEKTTVLAWTRPARRREPSEKTRVGQGPRLAGRGPEAAEPPPVRPTPAGTTKKQTGRNEYGREDSAPKGYQR